MVSGEAEPEVIIPVELVDRVRAGRAVPLLGAGISMQSGIASWPELVGRLRDEMSKRLGREIENDELDLLEAPLLYSHMQGSRQPLDELLKEAVGDGFEPNDLHRFLTQMPIRSLLTTNWDSLAEEAFREADRPVNVIYDEGTVATWSEEQAAQLVKLHGTIGSPETIVFGEDDYQRFYGGESSLLNLAKTIIATRSIFALGFSMRDAYVKMLFSQMSSLTGRSRNPHYVIVADNEAADLRSEYLRAAGFIVVRAPTSASDSYGLKGFLRKLHALTYSQATARADRTKLLIRETAMLEQYLGHDRTIRIRATMGPLAAPGAGNDAFGDKAQGEVERELRELCLRLADERDVKVRFIGSPVEKEFVLGKGYDLDQYRQRLAALVEAAETLGDRFEFAPIQRPSDANVWIVGKRVLIDSSKFNADNHRLYDRAVVERDAERVGRAVLWFDEEYENLADRAGGVGKAREHLITDAKKILTEE